MRTFYIPSGSMLPTLRVGDVLLVDEFEYRIAAPKRQDVVVFKPPIPSSSDFIKRVVAVPGDTLQIQNGAVLVNGKALLEPYESEPPAYDLAVRNYKIYVDQGGGFQPLDPAQADVPPRTYWQAANRIPKGFYFVLGDNRNSSDDSHVWGFAQLRGNFAAGPLQHTSQQASFAGRAFLILWPLGRMRVIH